MNGLESALFAFKHDEVGILWMRLIYQKNVFRFGLGVLRPTSKLYRRSEIRGLKDVVRSDHGLLHQVTRTIGSTRVSRTAIVEVGA
jgi:hypothetical protein